MSDSDSTEHISAADLTAGLPKSDAVTITTTRAAVQRLQVMAKTARFHTDETVGDTFHDVLLNALCAVVGHERMLDMDNDPAHAYCAVCGYAMPGEAKR